jgi:hypothetical protein
MTRYSAQERRDIAAGQFFTPGELRAKPWLGRSVVDAAAAAAPGGRTDPNNRPVSAEAKALAETPGVCAWCHEPGDDQSSLILQNDHFYRHPECQEDKDKQAH